MQSGNSIIIYPSPIVQQGLKSILLSRNIGISVLFNAVPECIVMSNWKNILLLSDTRYAEELLKHSKMLKKNGNMVIGIETSGYTCETGFAFEDIINLDDQTETIIQKISRYISRVSATKTDNQLSSREIDILTMVAQGFSNKQIAEQRYISIHTVITHRKNITFKLGIKSISGLTLYAALNNMVDSHPQNTNI